MSVQLEVTLCDADGELNRWRLVIGVAWARQSAPLHLLVQVPVSIVASAARCLGLCRKF